MWTWFTISVRTKSNLYKRTARLYMYVSKIYVHMSVKSHKFVLLIFSFVLFYTIDRQCGGWHYRLLIILLIEHETYYTSTHTHRRVRVRVYMGIYCRQQQSLMLIRILQ